MLTRYHHPALRMFADANRTAQSCECYHPSFDLRETGETYVIEGDIPGLTPKDVSLKLDHDTLIISGERKAQDEAEGTKTLWRERETGGFERRYRLFDLVQTDKIAAKVADGLLTVTLPKKEAAKPQTIDIQVQA